MPPDEEGVDVEGAPPAPPDPASESPEVQDLPGSHKPPEAIPYGRFKEVNDARKAAEARATAEAQEKAQLMGRLQELERRIEAAPEGSREEAAAEQALESEERRIRKLFGEDDAGKATYEALEEHFRHKLRSSGVATMEDVQRLVQEQVGGLTSRLSSGYATQAQLNQMVESGMLGLEDGKKVAGLLQQAMQVPQVQQALAADRTGNTMTTMLDRIVMHLARNKQIELWKATPARKRPENPLAPGNDSEPVDREPEFDGSKSPFEEVRALGKEKLAARYKLSMERAKEARR